MNEVSLKLPTEYDPLAVQSEGKILFCQDNVVPYLRLRVSKQSRAWVFCKTWRYKSIKRNIGDACLISLPEARLRAFEWARMLEDGLLPPTIKERTAEISSQFMTVEKLWNEYFEKHVSRKCRTADESARDFERYWTSIKKLQVPALTSALIRQWMNKLAEVSGEATANKQFTMLRAAIRWSSNNGYLTLRIDPTVGVKSFRSNHRIVYLKTGDEFARLSTALDKQSETVRDAIWMLLWTGQRKSNVLSMRWDEIDLENKVWRIPGKKTKSKRNYEIALTPNAMEIIERRQTKEQEFPPKERCDFVFRTHLPYTNTHLKFINKAWLEIRRHANLPELRIHDLRHTAATWLAQSGANAMIIKEALQHASVVTSQRYVHLAASDVRDFMDKSQQRMGTAKPLTEPLVKKSKTVSPFRRLRGPRLMLMKARTASR